MHSILHSFSTVLGMSLFARESFAQAAKLEADQISTRFFNTLFPRRKENPAISRAVSEANAAGMIAS